MTPLPDPVCVAARLRNKAAQLTVPIDLYEVIKQFPGLDVEEIELDGDGVFVDLGTRGGAIYLKHDAGFFRKRFTLAHEIGHAALASIGTSPQHYINKSDNRATETWCNNFAAELLMPKEIVLMYLRTTKISGLIRSISLGPSKFQVSREAFLTRVVEAAPLSIFTFERHSLHLKGFFLSPLDEKLRWHQSMNKIIDKLLYLGQPDESISLQHNDQLFIIGGLSAATNAEYIIVILRRQLSKLSSLPSSS